MAIQEWGSKVILDLSKINGFKDGKTFVDKDYEKFMRSVRESAQRHGFVLEVTLEPDFIDRSAIQNVEESKDSG